MSRHLCYRCFWPRELCWCPRVVPVPTTTRFVFLMHPVEFKRVRANTGRLAHLSLPESSILIGINFDDDPRFQAVLDDPEREPLLLYPAPGSVDVSTETLVPDPLRQGRTIIILDATWHLAKRIWKQTSSLHGLRTIRFTPRAPSSYIIKKQPRELCLSTIESVKEIIDIFHAEGHEACADASALISLFHAMRDYQIACRENPPNPSYRPH